MTRVVLLVPTSTYRAPDFADAAARLGIEVVVASEHRQALAEAMGDRAVVVRFDRPDEAAERIVALAEEGPVDAVVPIDEPGVLPAAIAASRLGLAHNPPEAVAATRDKALLRERLAGAGVPQPVFRVVGPGDDVGRAATEVGLPCVVKAVSLSASRGVIRADSPAEAADAAERVRAVIAGADVGPEAPPDPEAPLLVEEYVPGAEVAVEGLLVAGHLEVLAVFDKPEPMEGPYFAETILVTPSRLPDPALTRVVAVTARAADALGLREGPVHAELRVHDGDAWFLEVAARSIGGLCSRALRFSLDVSLDMSLEELILRHAVGLPVEGVAREPEAAGVCMLYPPSAGVLEAIRGQDAALAVPGIVGLELTIRPGTEVHPLPESARYLGFVFARGDSPGQVEAALRDARARLDIVVEQAPSG